jgi:hypothetical protein
MDDKITKAMDALLDKITKMAKTSRGYETERMADAFRTLYDIAKQRGSIK